MKRFLEKHQAKITGTLSCFDRLVFRGLLPLAWSEAMERFIAAQGLRIKDFKRFVLRQSEVIKAHAKTTAQQAGRPYIHLNGPIRKEDCARAIDAGAHAVVVGTALTAPEVIMREFVAAMKTGSH